MVEMVEMNKRMNTPGGMDRDKDRDLSEWMDGWMDGWIGSVVQPSHGFSGLDSYFIIRVGGNAF